MPEHWIRVHSALYEKPVVGRLVEACHVNHHEAVGLLVTFWSAVSMYAVNGQVACYSDAQIETWAKWARRRGAFAKWVREHHLDEDGRVREWDDYQGSLEYRRESDRRRKKAERDRRKSVECPADVTRDIRRTSAGSHTEIHTRARERNDNDTKREELSAVVVVDRARAKPTPSGDPDVHATARRLTVAANRATADRFGEQANPFLASSGPSHRLADAVLAAGVPVEFAERSVARQVNALPEPVVSSMAYFRAGVLSDWQKQGERDAAAAADPVVPLENENRARSPSHAPLMTPEQFAAWERDHYPTEAKP